MKEPVIPLFLNMFIINAIISINISGLLADNLLKGQEKECSIAVKVRRNTAWKTYTKETLRINCTVIHCGSTPTVRWCKIVAGTFATVNESDRIRIQWEQNQEDPDAAFSFPQFTNISMKDSGIYGCKMTGGNIASVSHSIDVSVFEGPECRTEVSVPEKRLWDAKVSSSLMLSCTVQYPYDDPRPAVTWCRHQGESCIQMETGEKRNVSWCQSGLNTGVSLLTFLNVSLSDSGEYRCEVHQRKACGDNIFSPSLQLNVTGKGQGVTEHCIKDLTHGNAKSGVLDLVMNIGRIFFFIAATVAVILLPVCWTLKLKGKPFSRDIPPNHRPASQELLEAPLPLLCQQPGMEKLDDDPSPDHESSDYEN